MRGFECATEVAAPIDRVFAVFTDFARAPEYVTAIRRLEILDDAAVRAGMRFRETRVLYGRQATEELELTVFEPPTRYVVEARSHGAHFLSEFRFAALDARTTRVTVRFEATPITFLARLFGFLSGLMMKGVREALEGDVADLKRVAEREG